MKKTFYPQNLSKMFLDTVNKYGDNQALVYKKGHHFESLTYAELKTQVEICASAFHKKGLEKSDRVIILSENRPEWVIVDLSVTMLGAVIVPVHSVLSKDQIEGIVEEIRPKIVIVSNISIYEKIKSIQKIFEFDLISLEDLGPRAVFFQNFMRESDRCLIEEYADKISPDDVASIIYTSGTAGGVKGVKLSHKNFISNVVNVVRVINCFPTDRFFSILPLSHVFERTAGYYIPLYSGASIGYMVDIKKLSEEIKKREPTIVIAVPRLFEKIYGKIREKSKQNLVKRIIFSLSLKVDPKTVYYKIFDKLVYSKIRSEFGGKIRMFVSGAAPLPKELGLFFEKVKLIVVEGYGLTECSPVISLNSFEDHRFGTVGHVLDDTEVKISPEGEIFVRGVGVMTGYLEPKYNKEAFEDGWFKTGDLGYIDKENFLIISGRKKDLIILSTGKKISPVHVEERLESCEYIDQALVFGESRKHICGLIVPDFKKIEEVFGSLTPKKAVKDEKIQHFMYAEMMKSCESLASYEKVKKFILLPEPFTIEGGELTPSFKLRRGVILEKYKDLLEEIYN